MRRKGEPFKGGAVHQCEAFPSGTEDPAAGQIGEDPNGGFRDATHKLSDVFPAEAHFRTGIWEEEAQQVGDPTFHGFGRQGPHVLGVAKVISYFLVDTLGKGPLS